MGSLKHREPYCSVIVPTYRRPAQLADCLDALARVDYPREHFEVVVVDDGGSSPLAPLVNAFRDRLNITLLLQPNAGPAAARNRGVAQARGELLVFTDDDCKPAASWLRHFADRFVANPDRAFGGHTINALPNNPYSKTSQLIIDVGYAQNNPESDNAHFFTSNNLALPLAGLRAVGGFDPNFKTSEDRDLCARWVANGLRMAYVPEAIVYHAHHLTLWSFCRQHFAYGRGAFRYHREQAQRWNRRIKIAPSFYLALLRYPFKHEHARKAVLLTALLLIWHLANTAGFVWEWWNFTKRPRHLSTSPTTQHTEFTE
jgi:GT2 family glycosyltransferase